jgi:hypothetical protein
LIMKWQKSANNWQFTNQLVLNKPWAEKVKYAYVIRYQFLTISPALFLLCAKKRAMSYLHSTKNSMWWHLAAKHLKAKPMGVWCYQHHAHISILIYHLATLKI